jgi:hypothetical protein
MIGVRGSSEAPGHPGGSGGLAAVLGKGPGGLSIGQEAWPAGRLLMAPYAVPTKSRRSAYLDLRDPLLRPQSRLVLGQLTM